jgi:hypothetical protein
MRLAAEREKFGVFGAEEVEYLASCGRLLCIERSGRLAVVGGLDLRA